MKNLISKEEKDRIDSICTQYSIMKYSINPDGTIDVDDDVNLHNTKLTKIPLRFGKVTGFFNCGLNLLTSLDGAPTTVGGYFECYENKLTSLVGSPTYVGGNFYCYYNEITSLEGAPHTVGGDLTCLRNYLTSTYSGDTDIEVDADVDLSGNLLPQLLQDNIRHIKLILKYQRHFEIWNDDLTLNVDNFKDLILEIEDGLE